MGTDSFQWQRRRKRKEGKVTACEETDGQTGEQKFGKILIHLIEKTDN